MRALITGISGFAGSHLTEHLIEEGWAVAGVTLADAPLDNLDGVRSRITLHVCNLELDALRQAFEDSGAEVVFHLAGQAHVAQAWGDRTGTFQVNTMGTAAVLEAARRVSPSPRVVIASSGEVYGVQGSPFRESGPVQPETPYALSKLMAEELGRGYRRWDDLPVLLPRAFNHTGPRQTPTFVCSEFSRSLAAIAVGQSPPILKVGNLEARRDFSDVRDIVRGYRLLAEKGRPGRPYNLCSGRPVAIQEILDRLRALAGCEVTVEVDPDKFRPLDVPELVGDGDRARQELGYEPQIPLEQTLGDLFAYWTTQLAR